MNLLMLILILLALMVAGGVFYAAWRLSSDRPWAQPDPVNKKEEPGDAKE